MGVFVRLLPCAYLSLIVGDLKPNLTTLSRISIALQSVKSSKQAQRRHFILEDAREPVVNEVAI